MKKINIYLILILFNYINLQERKIGNMTVDEFVKTVNSINLSENDYKAIIKSISNLIDKYYVYSEIAKNPGIIKGVDLIKELNEIDTKNIKYLDFYNKVQEIIYKTRDGHFNVVFYNISKYTYYLPIQFDIKTKGTIGLYAKLDEKNKKYHDFFDKRNLEIVNKNQNVKIKWISNSDPINYLMNNHFSLYKDEHAQFSSDLEEISKSSIFIPFYENKFKNFIIEYDNGDKITFDYKILYVIENKKLFLKFYEDEFLKNIHNNVLLKNTIIDYENLYLTKKGKNPNRNLLDSSWKNFNNKIQEYEHFNQTNRVGNGFSRILNLVNIQKENKKEKSDEDGVLNNNSNGNVFNYENDDNEKYRNFQTTSYNVNSRDKVKKILPPLNKTDELYCDKDNYMNSDGPKVVKIVRINKK